ncbi:hypothetical protein PEC302107_07090 [Pectobacterium araliae]|nr:hypothetical protein PEC302107_07090 [Pectobacterium carotovorum subsp. carotovorum]
MLNDMLFQDVDSRCQAIAGVLSVNMLCWRKNKLCISQGNRHREF